VATNDGLEPESLAQDLEECLQRWPELQLGAFNGADRLLGVIVGRLDREDPRTGWSDDIILEAEARGSGLGHQLLERQLEGFRRLGCHRVRGRSPQRLFSAVPFFERHGFRVVEKTVARGTWGIRDGEPLWITERPLETSP
jgi:GNAT superfamily N-acetyltransferase